MTRDEFLRALEVALTIDSGTLQPGMSLAQVPEWDSLGMVDFEALVDEQLDMQVEAERINACNTVDDLLAMLAEKLTD